MQRRTFVTIGLVLGIAPFLSPGQCSSSAHSSVEETYDIVIQVPGVTKAQSIDYTNSHLISLMEEPSNLFFGCYEFADTESAMLTFPEMRSCMGKNLDSLLRNVAADDAWNLEEVSVGSLGDDRIAFVGQTSVEVTWSAVRLDHQVLTALSVGMASDQIDFVVVFLEAHIESLTDQSTSLLPELSDMPVGWEPGSPLDDMTDLTVPIGSSLPFP